MEDLTKYDLQKDPFKSFESWFKKAKELEHTAEAFVLSTCGDSGVPSARVLLLKGFSRQEGFRFFTHSDSQKGKEIEENPRASMVFYWPHSERQVRISGQVKKITDDETLHYFRSRGHESQVASFVSEQSQAIVSREELERKFTKALKTYNTKEVPLPKNWQGYCIDASEFEFFVYGEFRLNDRFCYKKRQDLSVWEIVRLQP